MRRGPRALSVIVALILATAVLFAASANDDFTDTNGTNLTAHTPTGSGAAGTWECLIASCGAQIQTNKAEDTNFGNGNRFRNTTNLGFDEMDVQADFTNIAPGSGFAGVLGRLPTTANSTAYQCDYEFGAGAYNLDDGTSSNGTTEAWPGGTVTLKLSIRNGNVTCLANGVVKGTLTSNLFTGQTRAGLLLGNFDGAGPANNVDNYQSSGVSSGGATTKKLLLIGVGAPE